MMYFTASRNMLLMIPVSHAWLCLMSTKYHRISVPIIPVAMWVKVNLIIFVSCLFILFSIVCFLLSILRG